MLDPYMVDHFTFFFLCFLWLLFCLLDSHFNWNECFWHRWLLINLNCVEPISQAIEKDPYQKLVVLFEQRRESGTKFLHVCIDITGAAYHLHEFLPIWSEFHSNLRFQYHTLIIIEVGKMKNVFQENANTVQEKQCKWYMI